MTSSRMLELTLLRGSEARRETVEIRDLVIAGWTGRDPAAVEKHIAELEALGVRRPASTPIFYRVAAARLTTADAIEAIGTASSGEVEFVLLRHGGALWIGAGSDHTDREAEIYGVTVSKQMCDKPVAPVFWAFEDVADHWDRLLLRSHAVDGSGRRSLYQEGPVTAMLDPLTLAARYMSGDERRDLPDGTVMFCGTLAAHGGVRPAERFEFELDDPVHGRTIRHGYAIKVLPVLG